MPEPLRTAAEIAGLLNVKPSTIYEWARMNYIPHLRLGTGRKKPCLRFRWSAVERWLQEKENQGRPTRLPQKVRSRSVYPRYSDDHGPQADREPETTAADP